MPEMTDARIKELRELCEKATPGPWDSNSYSRILTVCDGYEAMADREEEACKLLSAEFGGRGAGHNPNEVGSDRKTPSARQKRYWELCSIADDNNPDVAYVPCRCGDTATVRGYADMAFICAARNALPDCLDEIERLRKERDTIIEVHNAYVKQERGYAERLARECMTYSLGHVTNEYATAAIAYARDNMAGEQS